MSLQLHPLTRRALAALAVDHLSAGLAATPALAILGVGALERLEQGQGQEQVNKVLEQVLSLALTCPTA